MKQDLAPTDRLLASIDLELSLARCRSAVDRLLEEGCCRRYGNAALLVVEPKDPTPPRVPGWRIDPRSNGSVNDEDHDHDAHCDLGRIHFDPPIYDPEWVYRTPRDEDAWTYATFTAYLGDGSEEEGVNADETENNIAVAREQMALGVPVPPNLAAFVQWEDRTTTYGPKRFFSDEPQDFNNRGERLP